ncbi:MAG: thiosulfate sulfurtransferase GlpE, partial [Glaciecola sp.]
VEAGTAVVVDIRDEVSFQTAHIPHARHFQNTPLQVLQDEVDATMPIIVTCYHGISSQPAAQFFVEQGFETVYSMDGGFSHWQAMYPDFVESEH